jgi:hypothetical protein
MTSAQQQLDKLDEGARRISDLPQDYPIYPPVLTVTSNLSHSGRNAMKASVLGDQMLQGTFARKNVAKGCNLIMGGGVGPAMKGPWPPTSLFCGLEYSPSKKITSSLMVDVLRGHASASGLATFSPMATAGLGLTYDARARQVESCVTKCVLGSRGLNELALTAEGGAGIGGIRTGLSLLCSLSSSTSVAARVTREANGDGRWATGISHTLGRSDGSPASARQLRARLTAESGGILGVHLHVNESKSFTWAPTLLLALSETRELRRTGLGVVLRWMPEPKELTVGSSRRAPISYTWGIGPVKLGLIDLDMEQGKE